MKQEKMNRQELLRIRKQQRALDRRREYERVHDGLRLEHILSFQK